MGIQDTFAANMRAYRLSAGITQEELAERAELHRTYIGRIEQKRINVSLKNIGKIADALGIDPMLFFRADNPAADEEMRMSSADELMSQHIGNHALAAWTENGIDITPFEMPEDTQSLAIFDAIINDKEMQNLSAKEVTDIFYYIKSKTVKEEPGQEELVPEKLNTDISRDDTKNNDIVSQ